MDNPHDSLGSPPRPQYHRIRLDGHLAAFEPDDTYASLTELQQCGWDPHVNQPIRRTSVHNGQTHTLTS